MLCMLRILLCVMHGAWGHKTALLRTCCKVFARLGMKLLALCGLCAGTHLWPSVCNAILCCCCTSVLLIGC